MRMLNSLPCRHPSTQPSAWHTPAARTSGTATPEQEYVFPCVHPSACARSGCFLAGTRARCRQHGTRQQRALLAQPPLSSATVRTSSWLRPRPGKVASCSCPRTRTGSCPWPSCLPTWRCVLVVCCTPERERAHGTASLVTEPLGDCRACESRCTQQLSHIGSGLCHCSPIATSCQAT